MKKKNLLVSMLMVTVLFFVPMQTLASNTPLTEGENTGEEMAYDSEAVDWENIEEIIVMKYSGGEFIDDALERGIKVTFEEGAMVSAHYTHFHSLSWIVKEDGMRALSMDPIHPFTIDKDGAWLEAVRYFQYHPMYTEISNPTKYQSMYNQFLCHADFARGFKTPWNLEPARQDKGYAGFVASGCN